MSGADEMENLPVNRSKKVQRRFPSAVHGVTPVAAPAVRRSGGCCGRESSAAVPSCIRRRGGKGCGEEEGSPAPLFIGEAW